MTEKAHASDDNAVSYKQLFLVFIVFYISDDTVLFGTNINSLFIIAKYILYAFLMLGFSTIAYIRYKEKRFKTDSYRSNILIFLIFISYLLTIGINLDLRPGYFVEMMVFMLAACIVNYINFRDFFNCFNKILYFFSVCSLIVLVFNFTLPSIFRIFPTTINYANTEFSNLLVAVVFKDISFFRNTGIFREPGVFIIYLSLGLIYQLFVLKKANLKYTIVYCITLLTTLSTTGFLVLLITILGSIFKKSTLKLKLISSFIVVTFILAFLLIPAINEMVFGKLNEDSSDYISAFSRISSFSVPLLIFFHNPLWGSGLTRFVDLYSLYSLKLFGFELEASQASTNTILNKFATFGLVYGSIVVYGIFKLARTLGKIFLVRIFIFAILIILFSSQELRFSLLFYIVVFYGLDLSINKFENLYLKETH